MSESKFLLYGLEDLQLIVGTCRYAASSYDILHVHCIHSGES